MSNPVMDPKFWSDRIRKCGGDLQRAMFYGPAEEFGKIHADQALEIRREKILSDESVLDVGCGYGRLLHVLGPDRPGDYVGMDVSPDWVRIARGLYPDRKFVCADLTEPFHDHGNSLLRHVRGEHPFDVAVAVWVKSMMVGNGYSAEWDRVHANMRLLARRVVVVW